MKFLARSLFLSLILIAGSALAAVNELDIRTFGAKCDGATDDSGAINRTVTAAGSGTVLIPDGTCVVASAITTSSPANDGITFRGRGKFQSVIKQGYSGNVFQISSPAQFVNLKILGVKASYATGSGIKAMAGGWAYIYISNVSVYSFSEYGIYLTDANLATIINSITNSNTLDGLHLGGSAHTVIGHDSESNGQDGIAVASNNTTLVTPFSQTNGRYQYNISNARAVLISPNTSQAGGNTNSSIRVTGSDSEIHDPLVVSLGGATYAIDLQTGANNTLVTGASSNPINVASGLTGCNFIGATNVTDASGNASNSYYGVSGTWTPALAVGGSATGITYTDQSGTYTRVGNMVMVTGRIVLSNKGGNAGAITITGLPFSSNSAGNNYAGNTCTEYANFAVGLTTAPMVRGIAGSTTIQMLKTGAGTTANLADTDITNTTSFHFELFYRM